MIKLDNKVALITGSSDGIGAATALLFSSLGAKIAIVGRDPTKLNKVAEACTANSPHGYKPVVIKADFESDDDVKRTFEETIGAYKQLDILINNAGVVSKKQFGDADALADYDRVMQVNVRSVIRLTELARPHLIAAKGVIVNVSSIAAIRSSPAFWSYAMSKVSLDMFTKTMACLLAPDVRVNSVNPGPVRTNILSPVMKPNVWDEMAKYQPMQRVGEPTDIANIIAFLASDASRNMTGSIVVVDSGALVADPYKTLAEVALHD